MKKRAKKKTQTYKKILKINLQNFKFIKNYLYYKPIIQIYLQKEKYLNKIMLNQKFT